MIGVVIVAHGKIADAFLETSKIIFQSEVDIKGVCIESGDSPEAAVNKIKMAVKEADRGDGVLILTDLFGGTPSNLSLSLLEEGKVEVVTGVNLPMLLKIPFLQEERNLKEFANLIKEYGRKNINVASHLLSKNRRGESL